MSIIRVTGLSKRFKEITAVNNLSFSVDQGDIYGFLGQNGAGKSTTIRMLLSLVRPTQGQIELMGLNLQTHRKEILRQVGAVIESPGLYSYLTAYDNISAFAKLSGTSAERKKLMEQLDRVGLADRAHSRVSTYSQGMKQRLGIAIALVHDPALILLDEPTNGLDPQGIADIRNLILDLGRNQHKTILISSHLLSEVELIADKILIIDKGKKMVEGRVKELFDPSGTILELQTLNGEDTLAIIRNSKWNTSLKKQDRNRFLLQIHRNDIPDFTREIVEKGVQVIQIQPRHSLEDFFLSLTTPNQHVDNFAN